MDEVIQQKVDAVVEDEVRRGYIIKDLPTELVGVLQETHTDDPTMPMFERVRFVKLTPRKKRLINEAVVKRYHADLKNTELLSNEQLRKLNMERGEWSPEKEARLKLLQEETSGKMRDLYFDGMDKRAQWAAELVEAAMIVRNYLDGSGTEKASIADEYRQVLLATLDRWMGFMPERQAEYDTAYAGLQGLERYSPDRDMQTLLDECASTEVADALQDIEDLRNKIRRYLDVLVQRRELMELQTQQARMYAESVESRRDTAEELARLYYLTEVLEGNIPRGPKPENAKLAATFDRMWDLPESIIQWLLVEIYFFLNGVPDEAREYLQEWGFIPVLRQSGSSEQPGESPAEPSVKPVGPAVTATPAPSLAPVTATS